LVCFLVVEAAHTFNANLRQPRRRCSGLAFPVPRKLRAKASLWSLGRSHECRHRMPLVLSPLDKKSRWLEPRHGGPVHHGRIQTRRAAHSSPTSNSS
jgi:hypothetical protein